MALLCIFCSNQLQKRILIAWAGSSYSCTIEGGNLISFVTVNAVPIPTVVSWATCLNDLRRLMSNYTWMLHTFSSVRTFLLDFLFLSQTKLVVQQFFDKVDADDFVVTHSCKYLQIISECIFYKFSFLPRTRLWRDRVELHTSLQELHIQISQWKDLSKQNFHAVQNWSHQIIEYVNESSSYWLQMKHTVSSVHGIAVFPPLPSLPFLCFQHAKLWIWSEENFEL